MKALMIYGMSLLFAFSLYGQKASVQLIVEPQEVAINQPFSITLKSNIEGDVVENWPSNFVKGYGIQSMSRFVQDVNTGKMMQEHVLVFNGVFTKLGTYKIGPFYVKEGNKTYASNTVKVHVVANPSSGQVTEDVTKQQLRQPAFGVIEVSSNKIYEGEPLVISGRVFSKERTFGRPVLRKPFQIEGISDMYPLQQTERWESVQVKRKNYESFSFEKKVLFPVGSGNLRIHPFEIILPFGFQDFNVVSSVPHVEILPLPANAPSEFIGAVGEFEIDQSISSNAAKQGDIIQMNLVISGKGNLHAIETPKVILPKGVNAYGDAEVKEDYEFGSEGASGKVTYTYHLQLTEEGEKVIKPVKVAFFNPKSEKYVTISAKKSINIAVASNPKFELQHQTDSLVASNNILNDQHHLKDGKSKLLQSDYTWLWITLIGILSLLVIYFAFKSRKQGLRLDEQTNFDKQQITLNIPTSQEINLLIEELKNHLDHHQDDQFYATFDKVLMQLMKHKLNISTDQYVSRLELLDQLESNNDSTKQTIENLFRKCDATRYGMALEVSEQREMLEQLNQIR